MLDLHALSKQSATGGKYSFALDYSKLSAALRQMADDIDAGKILPQKVVTQANASIDDYTLDYLLVGYAERQT